MGGAVEALEAMDSESGLEVRICTAPFGKGEMAARCEEEKRQWVSRYLGDSWLAPEKFICVNDKTGVPGVLLVDDKPEPSARWRLPSAAKPSWRYVVFTQPFNREAKECEGKPRLDGWSNWREVLLPLLDSEPSADAGS